MDIKTYTKESIKKDILVYSLGYLNAIKYGIINLDYTFYNKSLDINMGIIHPLFKMATILWLEKNNFDKKFIELIYSIIQLEDVLSLNPDKFTKTLDKIIENVINMLKTLPEYIPNTKNLCVENIQNLSFD